ncbi:hypothetical protein BDZ97DRAFT_190233 [Flammula alnicola]|nr:hypothetical protein BDZ97DRAFT_190233 [Flammula alnicola]
MKFLFGISFIPVMVLHIAPSILAYPVNGYQSRELTARQISPADNDLAVRFESPDELLVRGLLDKILPTKRPLTEDQKRAKIRKAEIDLRKTMAKHTAKVAKIENGPDHKVEVHYHGPGHAEHYKIAEKKAKQDWKDTPQLQQYKHVDVSASRSTTVAGDRTEVTAKYHNGPGMPRGPTMHHFVYHD